MTKPLAAQTPEASTRPVGTPADAQELIKHFSEVMDALLGLIDVETKLVRAGRLREAASLEQQKAGLARLYLRDAMCLRLSTPYLSKTMPEVLQILRQRHDHFRALLQIRYDGARHRSRGIRGHYARSIRRSHTEIDAADLWRFGTAKRGQSAHCRATAHRQPDALNSITGSFG